MPHRPAPPSSRSRLLNWLRPLLLGAAVLGAQATSAATLTVRAWGSLYQGVGPTMQVRVNGAVVGSFQVNNTAAQAFNVTVPSLAAGTPVDVVFTNDAAGNGEDRNLFVESLSDGATAVLASSPGVVYDRGQGAAAFDGVDTIAGQTGMYWSGALRLRWPQPVAAPSAAVQDAARFLQQATFGPKPGEPEALAAQGFSAWIDAQQALPVRADYVAFVQSKFDLGTAYRPNGASYSPRWLPEHFWMLAANAPDQLRQRTAFALHEMLMISLADSNLYNHARGYGQYLDTLNRRAFGNYRDLIEDISLSPMMGIYLSHIRNAKEDPKTGRMPDENFAREVMQLFSIGLYELNADGTLKRGADGQPIETYGNADVMALAKVFTGWSWGFPDNQLTDANFRWKWPDLSAANDIKTDLQRMKAYPGQASTAAVTLFAGKPWQLNLPAGMDAQQRLKLALDALFNHPNVGPFVGRQLIQHLVGSNPSPAYVQRVAKAFANNGLGVRGDLGAVVRAVLLDPEARVTSPAPSAGGKLREPVLRVAQWMRAFNAKSVSGEYQMAWEFDNLSQSPLSAPSVFSYFRPGYSPPGTVFTRAGMVAPEFQIVNEGTVANWVNKVEAMAGWGLGWTGSQIDVASSYANEVALLGGGNLGALINHIDTLVFAGRMSPALRQTLVQGMGSVGGNDAAAQLNRARVAVYLALTAPEAAYQP